MSDAVVPVKAPELDALIIGAGLTGMHQLCNLKKLGWKVRAYSGLPAYRQFCDEVAADGYRGFDLRTREQSELAGQFSDQSEA